MIVDSIWSSLNRQACRCLYTEPVGTKESRSSSLEQLEKEEGDAGVQAGKGAVRALQPSCCNLFPTVPADTECEQITLTGRRIRPTQSACVCITPLNRKA